MGAVEKGIEDPTLLMLNRTKSRLSDVQTAASTGALSVAPPASVKEVSEADVLFHVKAALKGKDFLEQGEVDTLQKIVARLNKERTQTSLFSFM